MCVYIVCNCVYVCMCMYVHTYICIYVYIYIYTHIVPQALEKKLTGRQRETEEMSIEQKRSVIDIEGMH